MIKAMCLIIFSFMLIIAAGPSATAVVIAPELEAALQALGPNDDVSVIVTLSDRVNPAQFKNLPKKTRRAEMVRAMKNMASFEPLIFLLCPHSRMSTFWPLLLSSLATVAPPGPVPTTMASNRL